MALDSDTYGTVAGIERLIGDIVVSRTFTDGGTPTVPSLTEAEAALDAIADVKMAGRVSILHRSGSPIKTCWHGYLRNDQLVEV